MTSAPPKPITGSEDMDSLMRINTELMSELWILRDRVMVLERVLEENGILEKKSIDNYEPSGEIAEYFDRERESFVRRVAGAPWETEFTVESLVEKGQR